MKYMKEGIDIDTTETTRTVSQEAGQKQIESVENLNREIFETENDIKVKFGVQGERLVELLNAPM